MATKILLLDTGKEWGGGTNSMFELLKRIDHDRFDIAALFYHNYPKGGDIEAAAVDALQQFDQAVGAAAPFLAGVEDEDAPGHSGTFSLVRIRSTPSRTSSTLMRSMQVWSSDLLRTPWSHGRWIVTWRSRS